MTVRYVDGTNGNDAYDGLAAVYDGAHGPKKTCNGAEDTPVAAGDLVHVRSGVYREGLGVDVNGSAGNPIEYRGDYAGIIWPGGGVVRITGSDDDCVATREQPIANAFRRPYRTFRGFVMDSGTAQRLVDVSANWVLENNVFQPVCSYQLAALTLGGSSTDAVIRNCVFLGGDYGTTSGYGAIRIVEGAPGTANINLLVESCLFLGSGGQALAVSRVGGITVRNCMSLGCYGFVYVISALPAGYTAITVNNCEVVLGRYGLYAQALGEIVEDYNNLSLYAPRTNVAVGAHSNSNIWLPDYRYWFQLFTATAANQVISPFDLGAWSQLINVAGTSPPATDMRGQTVQGTQREWGPLEYDTALGIVGGSGGGMVKIASALGRRRM